VTIFIPVPLAGVGGIAKVAARGIGDGDAPVVAAHAIGIVAVRPPSPVHLKAVRGAGGDVTVAWTRRSRAGWAWIDGVDAPIGEASEAYRVTIGGGARERSAEVASPSLVYRAAQQTEDSVGQGTELTIAVVQLGTLAASRPAFLTLGGS